MDELYEPAEDSYLLEQYVKKLAYGTVLDMCTGSGIQAVAAVRNSLVTSVMAADVQKEVVEYCKKKHTGITFLHSDLFSHRLLLSKKHFFDTIICNPPYLPTEKKAPHPALDGGKQGYEFTVDFLSQAKEHLASAGQILLVFSSLTKQDKVDQCIKENLLEFELLEEQGVSFERLYVYRIWKSSVLQALDQKGVDHLGYVAKGKRGLVFKGQLKKQPIAVKVTHPDSEAQNRLQFEAEMLQKVNTSGIGPQFISSGQDYIVMDFVEGQMIEPFLEGARTAEIRTVLTDVLQQMYTLDSLQITKEEMHRPYKHIIVSSGKPVLLDFERAHTDLSPANVTQFCQFITSTALSKKLQEKNVHIDKQQLVKKAQHYKHNPTQETFKEILKEL